MCDQAPSKNPYRGKEFVVHNRDPSTRPRKIGAGLLKMTNHETKGIISGTVALS